MGGLGICFRARDLLRLRVLGVRFAHCSLPVG